VFGKRAFSFYLFYLGKDIYPPSLNGIVLDWDFFLVPWNLMGWAKEGPQKRNPKRKRF